MAAGRFRAFLRKLLGSPDSAKLHRPTEIAGRYQACRLVILRGSLSRALRRRRPIEGKPMSAQRACCLLARLHLLGPILAIFAGLFLGKPLYPMTRTVWN